MPSLMPTGKQQYFYPNSNLPLAGGQVFTYASGTSNPKATYADSAGVTPNANPITLDSSGSALIFWSGSYKVIVKDALGNTIYTVDPYVTDQAASALSSLAATTGASLVAWIRTAVASVSFTLAKWLGWQAVNVMEFMTDAQRADVQAGTSLIDVAGAIQAAINYVNGLPANDRPEIFFPAGRYLILSSIQMYDNIVLVGVRRDIGYSYAFSHSSELIAGAAMNCMIDVTGSNFHIGHLGLYGNNVANYGLYTHVPVGQPRKSSGTVEYVAATLFLQSGFHFFNMGLIKGNRIQISNCVECGIDLSNSGDSDFQGVYINTINQDNTSTVNGPSTSSVFGVGIRIRDSSGNFNFRGGKIEYCRIGILLNAVDGVNITGINFNVCRKAQIYADSDNLTAFPSVATENALSVTSIQITGCRFLGGSSNASQFPASQIFIGHCRYVTISGNGFKRAGDSARDFTTNTAQGPDYGIYLYNAELCVVAGNDLYGAGVTNCLRVEHATPANAQHTINANGLDGTESVTIGTVRNQPNFGNLTFASGSNPIAQSTAKAWVKFNGSTGAIASSYNVASVTGAPGGTYSVNFTTPMANANYAVIVGVRNWFGLTDAGIAGACLPGSVTVYSTTAGVLSSNGEISVVVFGG